MLKASGDIGISHIIYLLKYIIQENKILDDWNKSIIMNFNMKGKEDAINEETKEFSSC